MKAKVSETGLEAKPVNPSTDKWMMSYNDFEAANKIYPLTEKQEPGSIIECELVWQWLSMDDGINDGWITEVFNSDHNDSVAKGLYTRQALQPIIPQPEKVKKIKSTIYRY